MGVAVLGLPKLHMYSFLYNVLQKRYGGDCWLLYTDTDSLVVDVTTEDAYADLRNPSMKEHIDFSDLHLREDVSKLICCLLNLTLSTGGPMTFKTN